MGRKWRICDGLGSINAFQASVAQRPCNVRATAPKASLNLARDPIRADPACRPPESVAVPAARRLGRAGPAGH